jgi:23S rRNA (pseudouridine1915-N3)-methyltransferase
VAGRAARAPQGGGDGGGAELKITVLALGRNRDADLERLIQGYVARCPWPVRIDELVPRKGESEAARLGRALPDGAAVTALDERGELATSEDLATRIGDWRDAGRDLAFLIGGADGLDEAMRARADWRLALGRLTWPHLMVRLLLVEQLYRASTILAGHPYHRS